MKTLSVIAVGALKGNELSALEKHYQKQLKRWRLEVYSVRSGPDKTAEAKRLEKKIASLAPDALIALQATGRSLNSEQLASWLEQILQQHGHVAFLIGGAYGLGQDILQESSHQLSLSPLTLAHRLARVLLIEQIYRAETILRGHPYHH